MHHLTETSLLGQKLFLCCVPNERRGVLRAMMLQELEAYMAGCIGRNKFSDLRGAVIRRTQGMGLDVTMSYTAGVPFVAAHTTWHWHHACRICMKHATGMRVVVNHGELQQGVSLRPPTLLCPHPQEISIRSMACIKER